MECHVYLVMIVHSPTFLSTLFPWPSSHPLAHERLPVLFPDFLL